jgi:hypothetical protein
MIIVQTKGGLGNQMFQYAFGRALSLKLGQQILIDTSDFDLQPTHQGFELSRVYNINLPICKNSDIRSILGWRHPRFIRNILYKKNFSWLKGEKLVNEPYNNYWPDIFNIDFDFDCYISGYWLSFLYFESVQREIRSDFKFQKPLIGRNLSISKDINLLNSISLHVRRGDYAANKNIRDKHGLCSLDYYNSAIQHICENVENPYFFIFSDDFDWVKSNLKLNYPCLYVDHNTGFDSYNDMHLMSLCKHNIIANSTFSWWAAWLNLHSNKIIVAPNSWLADKKSVSNYDKFINDLIPESWIML